MSSRLIIFNLLFFISACSHSQNHLNLNIFQSSLTTISEDHQSCDSVECIQKMILKLTELDQEIRNCIIKLPQERADTVTKIQSFEARKCEMTKNIYDKMGGWPKISVYGESTVNQYWLLVQHCDQNVLFQKEMLQKMKPLLDKKEALSKNYAYLEDRIAVNEKKKQKYGTQVRYSPENKVWEPLPLLDPKKVNDYRKSIGLKTLKSYLNEISQVYAYKEEN